MANWDHRYTEDENVAKSTTQHSKAEAEPVAQAEVHTEESYENAEQNGEGDDHLYNGEQDMDDEIDFNLGNGNGHDTSSSQEVHGPGIKEDG